MAPYKSQRLSTILHAPTASEPDGLNNVLSDVSDPVLERRMSIPDQLWSMELRKEQPGCREDTRYPDVWVKGNGTVVAVETMSREHMCMTIGLWLRKEFEAWEAQQLGVRTFPFTSAPKVSAYDTPEAWLNSSESLLTIPALKTMVARLQNIEGGMECLHAMLQQRALESLAAAHAISEYKLFNEPAFF